MTTHLFFDNQTIKKISREGFELGFSVEGIITFNWSSLLELLELQNLFQEFPKFDPEHPLFQSYVTALSENTEKDTVFHLYDNLFTECLKHIKAIKEIHPDELLKLIGNKKSSNFFELPLNDYEQLLIEHPNSASHSLILYLAWDRFCICMSHLFDFQSTNETFNQNLVVLKDCLIESYTHITAHGRTRPSFFRLAEALYYYEMREEFLQTHPEADWDILSKSVTALSSKEFPTDVLYVDGMPDSTIYTLDSKEIVKLRVELANLVRRKLNLQELQSHVVNLAENDSKNVLEMCSP